CRSERPLSAEMEEKIALFCDIEKEAVIQNIDVKSIYEVPIRLKEQGLDDIVVDKLKLDCGPADLTEWLELLERIKNPQAAVKIALVGKYVELQDAYLSVIEALRHAGIHHRAAIEIKW